MSAPLEATLISHICFLLLKPAAPSHPKVLIAIPMEQTIYQKPCQLYHPVDGKCSCIYYLLVDNIMLSFVVLFIMLLSVFLQENVRTLGEIFDSTVASQMLQQ